MCKGFFKNISPSNIFFQHGSIAKRQVQTQLVVNPVLGPEIIVMGGFTSPARDNVDIYTVNTDSWREGNMTQKLSYFEIEMLQNIPTTCRQSSATGNLQCFNN